MVAFIVPILATSEEEEDRDALKPLHDPLRLATYTPISPASVIVFREGEYAVAVDGKTKEVIARSTDHAEVLQAAVNHVQPGMSIFIKGGNYTLGSPVVIKDKYGINIIGENRYRVVLDGSALADYPIQIYREGTTFTGHISFSDLYIYGGISIKNAAVISFHRCRISSKDTGRYAVKINESSFNIRFVDTNIVYGDAGGLNVEITPGSEIDIADIALIGCYLALCNNFLVRLKGTAEKWVRGVRIIGSWLEPVESYPGHGIELYSASEIEIVGNYIGGKTTADHDFIHISGDPVRPTYRTQIIGNAITSTGNSRYGIYIDRGYYTHILGNSIYSDVAALYVTPNAYYIRVISNTLSPSATIQGNDVVIKNNIRYVTENSGVTTIPAGQTRVTVNHGLVKAPSKVFVTPYGNAKVWVDEASISDTSFDIVTDTAPTADLKVAWYAEVW